MLDRRGTRAYSFDAVDSLTRLLGGIVRGRIKKREKMEKCDFRFDWRVSWTIFMDGSVYAIEAI